MAQLIVRNLDEEIVTRLRQRAAKHRRSTEAEHREILREALLPARRRRSSLKVDWLLGLKRVMQNAKCKMQNHARAAGFASSLAF
jgi:plasmid stability protein